MSVSKKEKSNEFISKTIKQKNNRFIIDEKVKNANISGIISINFNNELEKSMKRNLKLSLSDCKTDKSTISSYDRGNFKSIITKKNPNNISNSKAITISTQTNRISSKLNADIKSSIMGNYPFLETKSNELFYQKNENYNESFKNNEIFENINENNNILLENNENNINNFNKLNKNQENIKTNKNLISNSFNSEKFDRSYSSLISNKIKNSKLKKSDDNSGIFVNSSPIILRSLDEVEKNKSRRESKVCNQEDNTFVTSPYFKNDQEIYDAINSSNFKLDLIKLEDENTKKLENDYFNNHAYNIKKSPNFKKNNNLEKITLDIQNETNTGKFIINSFFGSTYKKMDAFDNKFNKQLSRFSNKFGNLDSKNKFLYNNQYEKLINNIDKFETYKNFKILNEKMSHKFKLMPLIVNRRNPYYKLADKFFNNIKNNDANYLDIDKEMENYLKEKQDKEIKVELKPIY